MSVLIGHASINENKNVINGKSGDQTSKEVCIRNWYNKPWKILLRPINDEIAEKSALACEKGCNNYNIGYDQNRRNTLYNIAKIYHYDLSKVNTPCDTDCSAFMTVCAIAGGVNELEYNFNAPTTLSMADAFVKTGKYKKITELKYLQTDDYLKRGDILIQPGSHTVMVLSNGDKILTNTNISSNSYPLHIIDVSAYNRIDDYIMVKKSGVQGVILKIIRKDLQPDKLFETHYNGFNNVQIPIIAVYNYSYATTIDKAISDANAVIKILGKRKIPICLDIEDKIQTNLGFKLIDIINAYQNIVERNGHSFLLYTGLNFFLKYIQPYCDRLKCKNFWIARYYNGYNEMEFGVEPNASKRPTMANIGWQYTSSGKVNGINGNVDLNIIYSPITSTVVKKETIQIGTITASSLRIRSIGSTQGKILGFYHKGERVELYEQVNGWYRTDKGWISGNYVQI